MTTLHGKLLGYRRWLLLSIGITAVVAATTQSASAADQSYAASTITTANQSATAQFRLALQEASREEGVPLNLEQLLFASKGSYLFVGAPALGMERIDPIALRNGITQGMVYVDGAIAGGLQGLYVVRAVAAREVQLGSQEVRVQLLRRGSVQAEVPGTAYVRSLTVPPASEGSQAQLGAGVDLLANGQLERANCWSCPNGVTICVERPICGVDGLLPSGSSACK